MYVGSLQEVVSCHEAHADHIYNTGLRGLNAIRNKNDDDKHEYQDAKKLYSKKNTGLDGTLKAFGYKKGLKTKDENKTIGYTLVKGGYKALRPIGHAFDLASKGIDYVGDKIKSTSIGKKINDTIDDYYHDDKGEHAAIHAIGSGLSSYAIGRASARVNKVDKNKYYNAADAGIGGIAAINDYQLAKQKAKRTPEQIKKIRWMRAETDRMRRKARDERINNFWKDMKA